MRKILTGDRFFNINPAFIEDAAVYATRQYNQAPVVDESNSGLIFIPDPDGPAAGIEFNRVRATGYINARRARHVLGLDPIRPEEENVTDFTEFDPFAPPTISVEARRLAKRFTTNVLLKKRVKGTDFLYNTVLPSFRGFLVWNWQGKIEPRSERPADFAHLRSGVSAGATTLPIEDVTPWTASGGLWGRVLLQAPPVDGSGSVTSEVRKVTSAAYTSDANSITLTAAKTGAVTVSTSGATLSGGDSSTKATGTVTIGGTPAAGNTVAVTIDGITVVYTVESDETTATVAYMVAAHINANTQLRRFVSAVASGAVVTISSKWGVLTLTSPALANSHTGPVSNPTTAPVGLSVSGSGSSLSAGDYRVAYANRNAVGSTYISPYATVTVTAGQQINVPALAFPAGITSRDWFISKGANDPEMVLHTNDTTALGFAITAVPLSTAAFPPEYNTTGEELVRIALSFASNNQTAAILAQANLTRGNIFAGTYKWPGGRDQPTYTEVVATYVSAKDDFYPNAKAIVRDKALRARLGKDAPKELDLQAVDNFRQARHLAQYDFAKYIDHHWFNGLGSNGLVLLLEENDLIASSDDSGGHVNVLTQVEEITFNLQSPYTVSINKARLYSTGMFRENVPKTRPLLPSVLQWTATLDTVAQILDLPVWDEADRERALVRIAVRPEDGAGDWRGYFVFVDAGDGAGYVQLAEGDVRGTLGELITDLPAADPDEFDEVNTVTVRVDGGQVLTSRTEAEVLNGANLARASGSLFHFKTATEVSATDTTTTYELSGLLIGVHGTRFKTTVAGDDFALLDGSELEIEWPLTWLEREVSVKVATVNRDLADVTAQTFTWTGESLKYLPPSIQGTLDDDDAWRFRLFGEDVTDPADERYKLEIVGSPRAPFLLRGDASRPVSLSLTSAVPSDMVPPPGKGVKVYREATVPGNSVTNSAAYLIQMIDGSRSAVSFTYSTTLDETDSPVSNQTSITFSPGASYELVLMIEAETSTDSAVLTVTDSNGLAFTDSGGEATGTRYTVEFRDGKVSFYRDRHVHGNPFYVHAPQPVEGDSLFPMECQVSAGTDCTLSEIEIDDEGAALLYSAEEQIADFGSAQASLTVRACQQRVVGGVVVDGQITEVEFP